MNEIIPAVAVVVFYNDTVLLVKHGEDAGNLTGIYGLPAGRYETGESPQQAAIRELFEETGLVVKERDLLPYPNNVYTGTFLRKDGRDMTSRMQVFITTSFSGSLQSSGEAEPVWIPSSRVSTYVLLPNVAQAIQDAKQYQSQYEQAKN
jgi:ADP-ribose pyrophosphatase YjhB (NUDIX family)